MKAEIECPFCKGKIDADYVLENNRVVCPHCSNVLVGNASVGESSEVVDTIDEALLDPSDPAGYFNNFPPEDDF